MTDDDATPNDVDVPAFDNDLRKELIDYAKWIVNLASFFLTASLGYAGFFRETLTLRPLFYIGWAALSLCIAMNWLIVKRLVALPIVLNTPMEDRTLIHELYVTSMRNLRAYGTLQNILFVIGAVSIMLAIAWNASFDDRLPATVGDHVPPHI
ncbi:hypothetical protein RBSH_02057 [Rhodopirellula baltica SH28]|uniref:Uncharacterized protein n=1 Tax=Rhodopirellula baltica SH28 TaxID=993517 RepID=K5CFC9_RHOBT|nr:hypothetical protein [Rhodopirellula baltica]EKK02625.1 hypothetical protein RBSH_02057 [Rhodopirellula baltica SH28]